MTKEFWDKIKYIGHWYKTLSCQYNSVVFGMYAASTSKIKSNVCNKRTVF